MASNTPNYNLKKPAATDFYHVEDQNANMDKLDAALKGLTDGKAAATHAAQHAAGGSDPVTPGSIGAATAVHTHDDRYFAKEENLSAATAALVGGGSEMVPDDVLALLGRFHNGIGKEYVWKKCSKAFIAYVFRTTGKLKSPTVTSQYTNTSITLYPSYVINADGSFSGSGTPVTLTAYYSGTKPTLSTYIGYGNIDASGNFARISASTTVDVFTESSMYGFYFKDCDVLKVGEELTVLDYVNSSDPDAYPPIVPDGYEYILVGQLGEKLQIATGSYTGTGTYGSENPNSLTFDFEPKLVIVGTLSWSTNGWQSSFLWHSGDTGINTRGGSGNGGISISQPGNTLEWYSTVDATAQINVLNTINRYVAIG